MDVPARQYNQRLVTLEIPTARFLISQRALVKTQLAADRLAFFPKVQPDRIQPEKIYRTVMRPGPTMKFLRATHI